MCCRRKRLVEGGRSVGLTQWYLDGPVRLRTPVRRAVADPVYSGFLCLLRLPKATTSDPIPEHLPKLSTASPLLVQDSERNGA